jgi:hypothetical protein
MRVSEASSLSLKTDEVNIFLGIFFIICRLFVRITTHSYNSSLAPHLCQGYMSLGKKLYFLFTFERNEEKYTTLEKIQYYQKPISCRFL